MFSIQSMPQITITSEISRIYVLRSNSAVLFQFLWCRPTVALLLMPCAKSARLCWQKYTVMIADPDCTPHQRLCHYKCSTNMTFLVSSVDSNQYNTNYSAYYVNTLHDISYKQMNLAIVLYNHFVGVLQVLKTVCEKCNIP